MSDKPTPPAAPPQKQQATSATGATKTPPGSKWARLERLEREVGRQAAHIVAQNADINALKGFANEAIEMLKAHRELFLALTQPPEIVDEAPAAPKGGGNDDDDEPEGDGCRCAPDLKEAKE